MTVDKCEADNHPIVKIRCMIKSWFFGEGLRQQIVAVTRSMIMIWKDHIVNFSHIFGKVNSPNFLTSIYLSNETVQIVGWSIQIAQCQSMILWLLWVNDFDWLINAIHVCDWLGREIAETEKWQLFKVWPNAQMHYALQTS